MIGLRLRLLREAACLSQNALGNIFERTQQNIASWESDRTDPDGKTLIALADYFGVSIDYLFGRTDELEPIRKKPGTTNSPQQMNSDVNTEFDVGDRLKQLRVLSGMSEKEIAEKMGTSRAIVLGWEAIRDGSVKYIRSFCKAIGISLADFFDATTAIRSNDKKKPPRGRPDTWFVNEMGELVATYGAPEENALWLAQLEGVLNQRIEEIVESKLNERNLD